MTEVDQSSLDDEVVSMDLAPIEEGRVRSNFLVVALRDNTVRILELSNEQCLKVLSMQNMKEPIESVVVEEMMFGSEEDQDKYGGKLYVYTGLSNGLLIRTSIDMITGKMQDSRPKFLGGKPVKCIKLNILGKPAILALSSRPWLIYTFGNKQMISLLAFPYLDIATQIRLPASPNAIIGFTDNLMKIISLESFGQVFHSDKILLKYSGKKLLHFKEFMAVLESDREIVKTEVMAENEQQDYLWKAQISIYDPKKDGFIANIELDENETCTAFTYCEIKEEGVVNSFLVLACATGLTYYPHVGAIKPCLKVYQVKKGANDATEFVFYHRTDIENIALALEGWE